MAWNSLLNTVLAGMRRREELKEESISDYEQWRGELYSEIEVFVKRVNSLDLENAEDRTQFYDFVDKFSSRMEKSRERSETSDAAAEILINLEKLIELLEETSPPAFITSINLNETPWEKEQRRKREREREKERIERIRVMRNKIADQIESLNESFDQSI